MINILLLLDYNIRILIYNHYSFSLISSKISLISVDLNYDICISYSK